MYVKEMIKKWGNNISKKDKDFDSPFIQDDKKTYYICCLLYIM